MVPPPTYALPLSDVEKPKLTLVQVKKEKDKDKTAPAKADAADAASEDAAADDLDSDDGSAKAEVIDPIKTESLNILEDMVDQQRRTKLAKSRD